MAAADILDDLPPGVKFCPDDDELVELYLLPCVRDQPDAIPGVIVEDNTAANTLPWKLLQRRHLADDDEAYFYVRSSDAKEKEGARQDRRRCDGGGTWTIQRTYLYDVCVGGEKIRFSKSSPNLHMGGGKSGSLGWVMHEYTITKPHCPLLKICHVAFSGHGQKRKREPDDRDDCHGETACKCARLDAAAAGCYGSAASVPGTSTTTTVDQDYSGAAHAADQEPSQRVLTVVEISEIVDSLYSDDLLDFPSAASADAAPCFEEHIQAAALTTEQQVEHVMTPLPMVQETGMEDQQESLGSLGVDLESFCDVPDGTDWVDDLLLAN